MGGKAGIRVRQGISGHADNAGLLQWISAFQKKPERVFVVHGDDESCTTFTETIGRELGLDAAAPYSGTEFDLAANGYIREAEPMKIR